jgi:hypothetical protein
MHAAVSKQKLISVYLFLNLQICKKKRNTSVCSSLYELPHRVYLYNQELGISGLKPLCKKGSSSECRAPLRCVFAIPFQTTVQLQNTVSCCPVIFNKGVENPAPFQVPRMQNGIYV